mgnify:CR=1 FL=1
MEASNEELLYCFNELTRFDKVKKFLNKYKEDGFVWFLETFSMDAGRFMMSLNQLKEAGYFKYCKGIVFGRPLFYNKEWMFLL